MKLKKLVGYSLDTNQHTSNTLEDVEMVKHSLDKIIKLYGVDVLKLMYLAGDKRWSTYCRPFGMSLHDYLNS